MLWQSGLVIWLRYLQIKKQARNIEPGFVTGNADPMNLYPYMFTYGGPQLFVLFVLIVVTPLVYRVFLKQRPIRTRFISVLGLWVAAVVVAYGDVFVIAVEAKRLCSEEAGMKVYRTMQAEGILGPVSVRNLQSKGIKFVESRTPRGKPTVRESIENGEYKQERITDFKSQAELTWEDTPRSSSIVVHKDHLIERSTGAVLAEVVAYEFYPGWIDSRLLGLLGYSWTPPRCDDDYVPKQGYTKHFWTDLVTRTLNTP